MKLILITAEHFFKEEALWINELMANTDVQQQVYTDVQQLVYTDVQQQVYMDAQQHGACWRLMVHLRKPNSTAEEMEMLIKGIDMRFYSRLVLHDHLHLAPKYNLGGVHLNSRNEQQYFNNLAPNQPTQGGQLAQRTQPTQGGQLPQRTQLAQGGEESHYWKRCRVSRSCHSLEEVAKHKGRCNYVTLSPIFNSISKQGYSAAFTRDELQRAKELKIIDEKVVALGGIGPENIAQIKELGFGGAAVLGTIWKSRSLDEACLNLNLLINNLM